MTALWSSGFWRWHKCFAGSWSWCVGSGCRRAWCSTQHYLSGEDVCVLPSRSPLALSMSKLGVESSSVFAGVVLPTHVCVLSQKWTSQVCGMKPLGLDCKCFWIKQLPLELSHPVKQRYHYSPLLSYLGALKMVLSSNLAVLIHICSMELSLSL